VRRPKKSISLGKITEGKKNRLSEEETSGPEEKKTNPAKKYPAFIAKGKEFRLEVRGGGIRGWEKCLSRSEEIVQAATYSRRKERRILRVGGEDTGVLSGRKRNGDSSLRHLEHTLAGQRAAADKKKSRSTKKKIFFLILKSGGLASGCRFQDEKKGTARSSEEGERWRTQRESTTSLRTSKAAQKVAALTY